MSQIPARSFNSETARNESKKYVRAILLREIMTKNGKATTNDVKAAAARLGINRKVQTRTSRQVAPTRTYGNVPLRQQNPPPSSTTKKATLYLVPAPSMRLIDNFDNAKFLAEWYSVNIDDIKLRSTITDIEFVSTRYKTNIAIRVKLEFNDPRGYELDYIKELLTTELGEDDYKMVLVSNGMLVNSTPARNVFVKTRVVE